jgi:hypothetical protein
MTKASFPSDTISLKEISTGGNSAGNGGDGYFSGKISNSEKVAARIAVRVVDVLPNRNLVIEGTRNISFSGESQDAVLRGVVRQEDIAANNTIFSYNIADATILANRDANAAQKQALGIGGHPGVTGGTIEAVIEISGNLAAETRVDVRPTLGGTLDSVRVHLGDRVDAGAVLATMDRRELDAQVDAAAAAVAKGTSAAAPYTDATTAWSSISGCRRYQSSTCSRFASEWTTTSRKLAWPAAVRRLS